MSDLKSLAQLLAVDKAAEQAITASDPYLQLKEAPDLVSGLVLQSAANPDYSTKDKIVAGLLSGLTSGVLGGISENYQGRARDAYSNVLLSAASGQNVERPNVLSKSVYDLANQKADIFKLGTMLEGIDTLSDIAKSERKQLADLEKFALQGIAGAKTDREKKGYIDLLTGINQKRDGGKSENPFAQLMELSGQASSEASIAPVTEDVFGKIPSGDQTKIAQAQGTTRQLRELAAEFRNYPGSFQDLQAGRFVAGDPDKNPMTFAANKLFSRMKTLVPTSVRLMGDVGNLAEQEQQRVIDATMGSIFSFESKEAIAQKIEQLADTAGGISEEKLQFYKDIYAAGENVSLGNQINQPGIPQVGGTFQGEKVISVEKIE